MVGCSSSGLPTTGGTTTGGGGTTGGMQPKVCGGKAGTPCPSGQFCHFSAEAICGNFDSTGLCQAIPGTCPDVYSPVCGCDGVTYDNSCFANAFAEDVRNSGPCESPPTPPVNCGGRTGATCGNDQYCYFTPGGMCDWADGSGTCMPRPQGCADLYDPVCGCDSMTYGNECTAASNGVGIAYKGECGKPATDCRTSGCPAGKSCQLCWTDYQCLDPNVAC
jgi:hypothetical protein